MLEQVEVIKLRTIREQTPSVKRARIERATRSKSRDELLIEKFSELIFMVQENQRKQLEENSASYQAVKDDFYRLLAEKDAEIARLKEQANAKRGLFKRR
jgi:hypothetical protein